VSSSHEAVERAIEKAIAKAIDNGEEVIKWMA
jgi:flavin-binding protein dodecin